jgi:hypothetical protein
MSTNILQRGSGFTIQYTLTGTVTNGTPVLLGDQGLHGVALQGGVSGETISVLIPNGMVISHPVKGHDGTSAAAIAIFDAVYSDGGTSAFFDVNTSDTKVGYTLGAVASGATETEEVLLVLNP